MKSVFKVLAVGALCLLVAPTFSAKINGNKANASYSKTFKKSQNNKQNGKSTKNRNGKPKNKFEQRLRQLEAQVCQIKELLLQQQGSQGIAIYDNTSSAFTNTQANANNLIESDNTIFQAQEQQQPVIIENAQPSQVLSQEAYIGRPIGPVGAVVEGTVDAAGTVAGGALEVAAGATELAADTAIGATELAADVAVGAVETAGAIATAPFRALAG